eukprot:11407785-Prorocentrum_lima.AAC.1
MPSAPRQRRGRYRPQHTPTCVRPYQHTHLPPLDPPHVHTRTHGIIAREPGHPTMIAPHTQQHPGRRP